MKDGAQMKRIDETKETIRLKAEKEVDNEMLKVLIDADDGMLRKGQLPDVPCSSAAGSKEILDSLAQARMRMPWISDTRCCCNVLAIVPSLPGRLQLQRWHQRTATRMGSLRKWFQRHPWTQQRIRLSLC